MQLAGDLDGARLVAVLHRDADRALGRQARAGAELALQHRLAEGAARAHDLAGRAHLGAEDRVDAGELVEREDRFLDREVRRHDLAANALLRPSDWPAMQRAAILASGSPVALETNGTVREARGLTSST